LPPSLLEVLSKDYDDANRSAKKFESTPNCRIL